MAFPENTTALDGDEPLRLTAVTGMARDIDRCTRSVKRLIESDPDFPPIVRLGGRIHTVTSQWEAYKRRLIERGLQPQPAKTFPPRRAVSA